MGYITVVGVIYFFINLMIANIMQNVVRLKGYEEDKECVCINFIIWHGWCNVCGCFAG